VRAASSRRTETGGALDALLRFALLTWPREMRDEYSDDVCADIRAEMRSRGPAYAIGAMNDVVVTGVRERCAGVARDIRFALRTMRHAPLFAAAVILTMAIAIGINGGVGGLIVDIMGRDLPYVDPSTLVALWETNARNGSTREAFTYRDFVTLRSEQRTLGALGALVHTSGTLLGGETPLLVRGEAVDGGFFGVYRRAPQLGRWLDTSDERPGAPAVVVVSDAIWRAQLHADAGIVGRTVTIGDAPRRVIGVAPPRFAILDFWYGGIRYPDYWVPLRAADWSETGHGILVTARLRPGIGVESVDADLARIFAGLARRDPDEDTGHSARAHSLRHEFYDDLAPTMLVMSVAIGTILAIACANIANLFLSRASARGDELGIRVALGASRRRLVTQLFTEAALFIVAGGVLGTALAAGIIVFFARLFENWNATPFYSEIGVNGRMLGATALGTIVAVLLAGLVPALVASRADLSPAIAGGGRSGDRARGRRARAALIGLEIALAIALVAAAAMSVRSFQAQVREPLGFEPDGLQVVSVVGASPQRYATRTAADALTDRILHTLAADPRIARVAVDDELPFLSSADTDYAVEGRSYGNGAAPETLVAMISPGTFATLGIPLLAGRDFSAADDAHSMPVEIVSAAFAEQNFGGVRAALGRRVSIDYASGDSGKPMRTIVGIAGDVRTRWDGARRPTAYSPLAQVPDATAMTFIVRPRGAGVSVAALVDAAVASADPTLPMPKITPLRPELDQQLGSAKLMAVMLGVLALLALFLAIGGIYAVVSYDVARRTREIGIRIALGATTGTIVRMIMAETTRLALVGIVAGLALAVAVTTALRSVFVEVTALDPATYAGIVLSLALALSAGALVPSVRAARVDPAVTLRYD
jgi:putative ABC transport system permease protein